VNVGESLVASLVEIRQPQVIHTEHPEDRRVDVVGWCVDRVPAAVVATKGGTAATVNLPVTFNPATFGGLKNVYVNAFDNTGLLSHWVQLGTLTVQ